MAFDPNKDIKIEASETGPGVYVLRTRGLADKRRAELEIAGVPEVALNAAGGVINMIAGYSVSSAEVLADQTVGNVLTVGDDERKLLLAIRAVVAEKPSGGLWSKISGGGKGVLRLVDVTGSTDAPPRTALATMLIHRAAVRRAKDDAPGARSELEASIATFPGKPDAGSPPSIGGAGGIFDWQNHLAYLDLADLTEDVDAAAAHYGSALGRSDDLARRELGAALKDLDAFVGRASSEIPKEATRIIEHNLSSPTKSAGPTPSLVTIASPIWELAGDDGAQIARRASLVPTELVAIYYGSAQAERLLTTGAPLVAKILGAETMTVARAAWIARGTRRIWVSEDAPMLQSIGAPHPVHGLVSSVLADIARCVRAGGTDDEIALRYTATSASLDAKLVELSVWEGEQYLKVMSL